MSWWGQYVGIPYEQANCWQLVCRVYSDQRGVTLPSYGEISAADLMAVARAMRGGKDSDLWRPVEAPEPFDVVLMRGRSQVWHVGVATDPVHVLHSEAATDAVRVPMNGFAMRGRVVGFRRYAA